MKCVGCGSELTCTEEVYHYKISGLDNIFLQNTQICRCPGCGEKYVSIPAMPQLHKQIGKFLLAKKTPLTGKEIRFLRKNMGLPAGNLAEMISISAETISRWENEKQPIRPSHDRMLRMFYASFMGFSAEHNQAMVREGFPAIGLPGSVAPAEYRIDLKDLANTCTLPN